jgi:hypothetical protein
MASTPFDEMSYDPGVIEFLLKVAEAALDHSLKGNAEAAYQRENLGRNNESTLL